MYFLFYNGGGIDNAVILGVAFAWFLSHNFIFDLGILKPFKVVN